MVLDKLQIQIGQMQVNGIINQLINTSTFCCIFPKLGHDLCILLFTI